MVVLNDERDGKRGASIRAEECIIVNDDTSGENNSA